MSYSNGSIESNKMIDHFSALHQCFLRLFMSFNQPTDTPYPYPLAPMVFYWSRFLNLPHAFRSGAMGYGGQILAGMCIYWSLTVCFRRVEILMFAIYLDFVFIYSPMLVFCIISFMFYCKFSWIYIKYSEKRKKP